MQSPLSIPQKMEIMATIRKMALSTDLIRHCDTETIQALAVRIKTHGIEPDVYMNRLNIQLALASSPDFAERLAWLASRAASFSTLDALLHAIDANGEDIMAYSDLDTLHAVWLTDHDGTYPYCRLRFFKGQAEMDVERYEVLSDNLFTLFRQDHEMANDWANAPDDEKHRVLSLPFLREHSHAADEQFAHICRILHGNHPLQELLLFMWERELHIGWLAKHYEAAEHDCGKMLPLIQQICGFLEDDMPAVQDFLDLWKENGCRLYDLEALARRLNGQPPEEVCKCFASRGSYINTVLGNRALSLPLAELPEHQEALLIHAIASGKKRFLKLVQENLEVFRLIGSYAWIADSRFYTRYINLNDMTVDDLRFCGGMNERGWQLEVLTPRIYTFKEIRALYQQPKVYLQLYNLLLDEPIDRRLLLFRQLVKHRALPERMEESELACLCLRLREKPLFDWMRADMAHIEHINCATAVRLLSVYPLVQRFLPELSGLDEANLLWQNAQAVQAYAGWPAVMNDLRAVDSSFKRLADVLSLSDAFIQAHAGEVASFLVHNGAHLALTYYEQCLREHQRESLRRIVKAVLMGEYHTLKYFDDDLRRELEYAITPAVKTAWMNNLTLRHDVLAVEERDDFYSTMRVGELPLPTCLSYKNGKYNECLLSCFDSSKKLLFVFRDGKVVGRAMLRLTKGAFHRREGAGGTAPTSMQFVDLDRHHGNDHGAWEDEQERLTLFLERAYIAHLPPHDAPVTKRLLAEAAARKADALGCTLILNGEYDDSCADSVTRTRYFMFIPKSKAGAQYLDSLSGEAKVSDEGSYRGNTFLLWVGSRDGQLSLLAGEEA